MTSCVESASVAKSPSVPVIVTTSDGVDFVAEADALKRSTYFRSLLDDTLFGMSDGDGPATIMCPLVDSVQFKKILHYLSLVNIHGPVTRLARPLLYYELRPDNTFLPQWAIDWTRSFKYPEIIPLTRAALALGLNTMATLLCVRVASDLKQVGCQNFALFTNVGNLPEETKNAVFAANKHWAAVPSTPHVNEDEIEPVHDVETAVVEEGAVDTRVVQGLLGGTATAAATADHA